MDKVVRRREWSEVEKRAIVAECDEPGATVSAVARKHDMSPSLLFRWRAALRRGPQQAPLRHVHVGRLERLLGQAHARIAQLEEAGRAVTSSIEPHTNGDESIVSRGAVEALMAMVGTNEDGGGA